MATPFFEVSVQCSDAQAALLCMFNLSSCLLILQSMRPVHVLKWYAANFFLPSRQITLLLVYRSPCSTESDDDIVLRVLRTVVNVSSWEILMLRMSTIKLVIQHITHCCRRGVPAPSSSVTHSLQDRSIAIHSLPCLLQIK